MKKSLIAVIALGCMTSAAFAQSPDISLYTQVGTEGVGLGVGTHLTDKLGARAEINGFSMSRSVGIESNTYQAKAELKSAAGYFDLFPFEKSSFRLTTGVVFNDSSLHGNATGSNVNINGTSYSVGAGESLNGRIKLASVAPYLGIGFGHEQQDKAGFSVFGDVGAYYANPKAELNATPGLASAIGAANLAAEQAKLQSYADRLKFYPVVKVGVAYRF